MDTRIYDVLLAELQGRYDVIAQSLVRGGCASYDEYKYLCGQLRGLEAALGTIEDLKTRMETLDE